MIELRDDTLRFLSENILTVKDSVKVKDLGDIIAFQLSQSYI